jgi:beta-galactosidase
VPDYDRYHKAYPNKPFTSSEDTSAFMTRGEYKTVKEKNLIASYDDDAAQWGNTHRDAWQAIDTRPFVAGGFVWTGFDYRGEPTPNDWPSVSSVFGIMDLNGFAKTAYYIHQVQWIKDKPLIHIAPHWNWKQGENVRVMVMTNVERIKLLLNGRELGEQKADPYRMNNFNVVFEPGKLEAVGYKGGREVVRTAVETTGEAVSLELAPDRAQLAGDGFDALPITVRALDAQGRAVPLAQNEVTFAASGGGRSIGHGNGDPNSHEDEKGATRRLFNGLAQLIVQTNYEAGADITVSATAAGLKAARVTIPVRRVAAVPYVELADAPLTFVRNWRIAPDGDTRPDPNQKLAGFDMNTWGWGSPPMRAAAGSKYHLYRSSFTPRKNLADGNGLIRFGAIKGKAEIWLNGKLIGKKDSYAEAPLDVVLPAGAGKRELNVLIEAEAGQGSGIEGHVTIEPAK